METCSRPCLGKRPSCADADFECTVCCDTLLDPVVAPCGHDMCNYCYERWLGCFQGGVAFCPMCRSLLPSGLAVCLRLKRTISALQPEAVKRRRTEVADELACDKAPLSRSSERRAMPTYPTVLGPYSPELFAQSTALAAAAMTQYMATAGAPYATAAVQQLQQQQQPIDASGCIHPSPAPMHHLPQPRWQHSADTPSRMCMARRIAAALRVRGLQAALGPRFADTVRLLELMLYRAAPSKDAYLDEATLDARIVQAVRARCAARARAVAATASGAVAQAPPLHVQPLHV